MKLTYIIAAVVLLAYASPSRADDAAPAGNAKLGQQIYRTIGCWECHGTVGQGGGTAGPRLAATGLPYVSFLAQLRVPRNAMPPYEAKIASDADVENIYAYVASIQGPKAAKDIPLLNALH